MGLFDRGKYYRLEDREPEKKKKERPKGYTPPKPLSALSCALLLLLALALCCYSAALLVMRFAGVEAEARANTALDGDGAVVDAGPVSVSSTLHVTFRDREGTLRAAGVSLLGNTEAIGDTVLIRYVPGHEGWVTLSSQSDRLALPFGGLFLSVFLVRTAYRRFKELKQK